VRKAQAHQLCKWVMLCFLSSLCSSSFCYISSVTWSPSASISSSCSAKPLSRTIEWFGLEGTFRGRAAQSYRNKQGHLPLDQVAQSRIQLVLGCFQGRCIYHLSGQPIPVFHHPHCKKFLPYNQSKSIVFYFKAITPCPIAGLNYVKTTEKVLCYQGIKDGPVVVAVAWQQDKACGQRQYFLLRSQVGEEGKLLGM